MAKPREIRADYDRDTIVLYQAYPPGIADAALSQGRFVAPFSLNRMTWIKPSFLWLMERSNWGTRRGQERTLAVRITRQGWDRALSLAVPTDPAAPGYANYDAWRAAFEKTERVRKMRALLNDRRADRAARLLPHESVYPLPAALRQRIGASG
jgi:Domain of unknown function (DUF4291)